MKRRAICRATAVRVFATSVFALVVLAGGGTIHARAQEAAVENTTNPLAGNREAIKEGASQFRIDCALCHGLHAEGGSRGPDLTRGVWNHGGSDAELFHTITTGVPGTLMPANDVSDTEAWEIIAFLRTLTPSAPVVLRGNRSSGEKLFFGDANCSLCHMVNGKGGRLGPDLSRVAAARSPQYLAKKIRNPNSSLAAGMMEPGREWPLEYQTVTVITNDGQSIHGVLRNEDSFSIQMMDTSENLRSYLKKNLRSVTHEAKSVMPAYTASDLSEEQMQDLLAYLDSLRPVKESEASQK